jgi:hypothetical protein
MQRTRLRLGANALAAFLMLATSASAGLAAGGGHTGGSSGSHVSSAGMTNSNGPNSSDRDKGLARAEDRRSKEASLHSKAKGDRKKKSTAKKLSKNEKH